MRWTLPDSEPGMAQVNYLFESSLQRLDWFFEQPELNDEAVHQVRLELKKLRARLRLLQETLPEDACRKALAAVRQLSHDLAPLRDHKVLRQTLISLLDSPGRKAMLKRLLTVVEQHHLCARPSQQQLVDDRQRLQLRVSAAAHPLASGKPDQWLKHSYQRCRKQWQTIRRWPTASDLHRWRRSVKEMQYQLRLLVPGQHRGYQSHLRQLGQRLGELHDLHELERWMGETSRWFWLEERLVLSQAIRQRESELLAQIMALGKRLYIRKPEAFCRWQPAG